MKSSLLFIWMNFDSQSEYPYKDLKRMAIVLKKISPNHDMKIYEKKSLIIISYLWLYFFKRYNLVNFSI